MNHCTVKWILPFWVEYHRHMVFIVWFVSILSCSRHTSVRLNSSSLSVSRFEAWSRFFVCGGKVIIICVTPSTTTPCGWKETWQQLPLSLSSFDVIVSEHLVKSRYLLPLFNCLMTLEPAIQCHFPIKYTLFSFLFCFSPFSFQFRLCRLIDEPPSQWKRRIIARFSIWFGVCVAQSTCWKWKWMVCFCVCARESFSCFVEVSCAAVACVHMALIIRIKFPLITFLTPPHLKHSLARAFTT